MAKNNKMIGLAATAALLVVAVVAGTYPSWKSTPVVSGEYTGSAKGCLLYTSDAEDEV